MSNFPYSNPISSNQASSQVSLSPDSVFGVSYSVLNTGGYMEVANLSDLVWNYTGGTGLIEGSTIPIQFNKGINTTFSPDILTLGSDNMSSGRRRLGMLVYVQETRLVYQFTIPNYQSLWNAVTGLTGISAVTFTDYATLINNRSQAGQEFINAWTGSTIDGYNAPWSGATWRVYPGSYPAITGGTYDNGTAELILYNSTGGTIIISGITTGTNLSAATNDIIVISSDTISTKYQTQIPDSVLSVAVGGAPPLSASTWKTYNMVQVLDTILFPTLSPTYTIPTLTLSSSVTGTREVGSTITPTLTLIGTKNDAGNFTELTFLRNSTTLSAVTAFTVTSVSNVPDQYGFTNPNSPNSAFTATYLDSFVIAAPTGSSFSSTVTYGGASIYLSGSSKQNNKGDVDTTPAAVRSTGATQLGSTTLTPTDISITGIYPYFYGTSSSALTATQIAALISGGTAQSTLSSAQDTLSITFSATSQFIWFAHNAANTTKTKWFVDSINNGNISSGSDLFSPPTTQNVSSPSSLWSNIPFKVYISNYATTTTAPPNTTAIMQLRNS